MLPSPRYASHPEYQFDHSLAERLSALQRLTPFLEEARETLTGPLLPDYERIADASAPVQKFKAEGVHAFRLSPSVPAGALRIISDLRDAKSRKSPRQRSYEDCVAVRWANDAREVISWLYEVLAGEPASLLETLYDGRFEIELALFHANDEEDAWVWSYQNDRLYETSTLFYHVDTTVNRLKAMLYLTDHVDSENGAFKYVVGSHLWNRDVQEMIVRKAVRNSGLYLRDPATRRTFAALPTWLQLKNDVGSELSASSPEAQSLLAHTKTFPSSTGRLVVFDPNGVHCGGLVKRGARDAIQIVVKPVAE